MLTAEEMDRTTKYNKLSNDYTKLSKGAEDVVGPIDSAGKIKMHGTLNSIVVRSADLLSEIKVEIKKEDEIRSDLIKFFKRFLVTIVIIPVLAVTVWYLFAPDKTDTGLIVAMVTSILSIPVSVLGVLKSIADNLFNDKYRNTLPDMITKITESLSKYNNDYK